ncbi:hypothetical protein HDA40_003433 [Hamadaea flava]|uniref:Uncharacterized protein n=1 Tax=Hamadaea flava TaxID=1742688 RepID=A0ABV8LJV8_9ACTN|nr:hypothetical protein [Hamadaea flava]MCP2324926.1 hypothetical protein [Hamadaea flava]
MPTLQVVESLCVPGAQSVLASVVELASLFGALFTLAADAFQRLGLPLA